MLAEQLHIRGRKFQCLLLLHRTLPLRAQGSTRQLLHIVPQSLQYVAQQIRRHIICRE